MKKLWKILLAMTAMSFAICLWAGTTVFAKQTSGYLSDDVKWVMDTNAKTLTISRDSSKEHAESISLLDLPKNWENLVTKIILDGPLEFWESGEQFEKYWPDKTNIEIICNYSENSTWTYDPKTDTITLSGSGTWYPDWSPDHTENLIIGDGITTLFPNGSARHLFCGKDVRFYDHFFDPDGTERHISSLDGALLFFSGWAPETIEVDPDNPYYSVYDNGLYTKDYSQLIFTPSTFPDFPPNLKVISPHALPASGTFVFPWGSTTLKEGVFNASGTFVLPDTMTDIAPYKVDGPQYYRRTIIFSSKNTAAAKVLKPIAGGVAAPNAETRVIVMDSLAEYYPNQAPSQPSSQPVSEPSAPSTPPESSQPSTPASSASSKPVEPSQPAESSAPSSAPAESSQPSEPSSAVSEPASESQPESSASAPEESMDESSDEASQVDAPDVSEADRKGVFPIVLTIGAVVVAAALILLILRKRR